MSLLPFPVSISPLAASSEVSSHLQIHSHYVNAIRHMESRHEARFVPKTSSNGDVLLPKEYRNNAIIMRRQANNQYQTPINQSRERGRVENQQRTRDFENTPIVEQHYHYQQPQPQPEQQPEPQEEEEEEVPQSPRSTEQDQRLPNTYEGADSIDESIQSGQQQMQLDLIGIQTQGSYSFAMAAAQGSEILAGTNLNELTEEQRMIRAALQDDESWMEMS